MTRYHPTPLHVTRLVTYRGKHMSYLALIFPIYMGAVLLTVVSYMARIGAPQNRHVLLTITLVLAVLVLAGPA